VKKTDYTPPKGRPVHILNLASGNGTESYVLSAFFGSGQFLLPSNKALVDSVDISKTTIEGALEDQSDYLRNFPNGSEFVGPVRFSTGDATQSELFDSLRLPLDVVWIRHPNVTEDLVGGRPIWKTLIRNAVDQLRPGGIVIMTHYSKYEGEIADSFLSQAGAEILVNSEENQQIPSELKRGKWEAPKDPRDLFITAGIKP